MGIRVTRDNLVPLRALGPFFAFGLLSFIVAPVFLLMAAEPLASGAYRHHLLLATLHVTFLGWGTSIALGSLQQMAPVVFGTELHSSKLARWIALPYISGVASLAYGFITLRPLLLAGGAFIVPLSVVLAMVNVWRTQTESAARPAQLIRPYVMGAAFYLVLTVLAGAALALNLTTGWLQSSWVQIFPGHVTMGLVGWFAMLVLGISYHLLPFFGLTPKKEAPRWAGTVRWLLHISIGGQWLASFYSGFAWLVPASFAVSIVAIALFLYDARALFARRPRNKVHPMVTHVRFAHLYLALMAGALLYALVVPTTEMFVVFIGVLGIGGWLSNTILGYLHRILPFFVWHNKYWGRATEPGVPSFREMVVEGPAWLGLAVYNAGIIGLLVAIPTHLPLTGYVGLLLAGAVISGGNLLRTLFR